MKKRLLALFLSLLLLPCVPAHAADGSADGFDNFRPVLSYADRQFRDVVPTAWYAGSVAAVYTLGLMNGRTDDSFVPDGTVTLAESIALAARLHRIFNSGSMDFSPSEPWYQSFLEYAIRESILREDQFPDLSRTARRWEFAQILSAALPAEALTPVNRVDAIPDVPAGLPYTEAVFLLYRAGVLSGSDTLGNFLPETSIARSEAAAIIQRMAQPDQRVHFALEGAAQPTPFETLASIALEQGNITDDGNYRLLFHRFTSEGGYEYSFYVCYLPEQDAVLLMLDDILPGESGKIRITLRLNRILSGSYDAVEILNLESGSAAGLVTVDARTFSSQSALALEVTEGDSSMGEVLSSTFTPGLILLLHNTASALLQQNGFDVENLGFTALSAEDASDAAVVPRDREVINSGADAFDCLKTLAEQKGTADADTGETVYRYYSWTNPEDEEDICVFELRYGAEPDSIDLMVFNLYHNRIFASLIRLPRSLSGRYISAVGTSDISGNLMLDPETFLPETIIVFDEYEGSASLQSALENVFTDLTLKMLIALNHEILAPAGYTLREIGFTALSMSLGQNG